MDWKSRGSADKSNVIKISGQVQSLLNECISFSIQDVKSISGMSLTIGLHLQYCRGLKGKLMQEFKILYNGTIDTVSNIKDS